jgi:hypothetical protein
MAFGDADRDVFLNVNEFGSTVVVSGTTATGVLFQHASAEDDGVGRSRTQRHILRVKRGTFTRPAIDGTVTVSGNTYRYAGVASRSPESVSSSSGWEHWLLVGGGSD